MKSHRNEFQNILNSYSTINNNKEAIDYFIALYQYQKHKHFSFEYLIEEEYKSPKFKDKNSEYKFLLNNYGYSIIPESKGGFINKLLLMKGDITIFDTSVLRKRKKNSDKSNNDKYQRFLQMKESQYSDIGNNINDDLKITNVNITEPMTNIQYSDFEFSFQMDKKPEKDKKPKTGKKRKWINIKASDFDAKKIKINSHITENSSQSFATPAKGTHSNQIANTQLEPHNEPLTPPIQPTLLPSISNSAYSLFVKITKQVEQFKKWELQRAKL